MVKEKLELLNYWSFYAKKKNQINFLQLRHVNQNHTTDDIKIIKRLHNLNEHKHIQKINMQQFLHSQRRLSS